MSRLWDRWWLFWADPYQDPSDQWVAKFMAVWGGSICLALAIAVVWAVLA